MKPEILEITEHVSFNSISQELIFKYDGYKEIVRLEPLTTRLLMTLIHGKGAIVTREQLIAKIWDGNEGVGNKALTKNIYKLRKEFERKGFAKLIETIPKNGYRLRVSSVPKIKSVKRKKLWLIAAATVVVALIVLKTLVPGLLHTFSHRVIH